MGFFHRQPYGTNYILFRSFYLRVSLYSTPIQGDGPKEFRDSYVRYFFAAGLGKPLVIKRGRGKQRDIKGKK